MNVALVHELLTMRGGAERVAKVFSEMFPEAPIYTLLYNEKKLGDWFPAERVRTAKIPTPYSLLPTPHCYNHHLLLSAFPDIVESWDFSEFDLVISSSSAFAHGIITNGKPKHLCYVHSPARYLWDRTHDVLDRAGKGLLGPAKRAYLEHIFHRLRIWDSEAADRPDALIAASKEVQRRIELYWRRDAEVIHPPLDDFWFDTKYKIRLPAEASVKAGNTKYEPYYLVVSTLTPYKRIDLAIHACNARKTHLKVVGEGADLNRLKRIAGPTVEFLGYQSNEKLKELYTDARATLFVGDEDFGIVPLESMSQGTPVIGYAKGGALETIIEGETGEFFTEPTADSLQEAMEKLEQNTYSKDALSAHAHQFSRDRFEQQVREAIKRMS